MHVMKKENERAKIRIPGLSQIIIDSWQELLFYEPLYTISHYIKV